MSADPMIHDVTNSRDLNRYSYVHNNPLSYVDMNGYGFFKFLKKIAFGIFSGKNWKAFLAIAVAVLLAQPWALPAILPNSIAGSTFLAGAVQQGITGGISSVIATGRPKAFLTGFGQGFATYGVGHGLFGGLNGKAGILGITSSQSAKFGSAAYFGKAVAHGVVGGAFAEIRGGSFSSGFLAAGFSSAVAPLAPSGNIWSGAAFSAAAGGVGSVLGGGKFADGAVTGAFTYLFNEALTAREGNSPAARVARLINKLLSSEKSKVTELINLGEEEVTLELKRRGDQVTFKVTKGGGWVTVAAGEATLSVDGSTVTFSDITFEEKMLKVESGPTVVTLSDGPDGSLNVTSNGDLTGTLTVPFKGTQNIFVPGGSTTVPDE